MLKTNYVLTPRLIVKMEKRERERRERERGEKTRDKGERKEKKKLQTIFFPSHLVMSVIY